jgi:sulfur transfer protein SufE/stress-induced morphogen
MYSNTLVCCRRVPAGGVRGVRGVGRVRGVRGGGARSSRLGAVNPGLRGFPAVLAASTPLPASLEQIVSSFEAVPDPMARYKQLLFYATSLSPMDTQLKVEENRVKGCTSQVWVYPTRNDDGTITWQADSDSQLTKGLAALLVRGLSGCTAEQIISVQPDDFITKLGLGQSLTPSRSNGFLSMFKVMQAKSLEIMVGGARKAEGRREEAPRAAAAEEGAVAEEETRESSTPVADSMRQKLTEELAPALLNIVDESGKHAGHAGRMGVAPGTGETHFIIEVTSEKFEGLTSLKRHRLVYSIVDDEVRNGPVHALSLVTKAPSET